MPNSIVALFSEDIRFEQNGQHTLVGVLPDNVAMPKAPGALPKLGIFVRVQVETQASLPEIALNLKNTDGAEIELSGWEMGIIEGAKTDAERSKMPIYGLLLTAVISPFRVPQFGQLILSANIDGVDYIAGALNFMPAASSASGPPSSQSQPASPPT